MAVAFDAKAEASFTPAGSPQTYAGMTVGSGSNRALILALSFGVSDSPGTVTANWDSTGTNQSMTVITSGYQGNVAAPPIFLFGLVAPTSGNKTVSVSWTGTVTDIFIALISFTGANQTGGSTTFVNANNTNGTTSPATNTVTSSTTGAAIVAAFKAGLAGFTTNQTAWFNDTTLAPPDGAGAYNVGTASVAFSFTMSVAAGYNMCGVAIAAPSATVKGPQMLTLLGVA